MIKLAYILDSVSGSFMHFTNGKESMKLPMKIFSNEVPLTINVDHIYRVSISTVIKNLTTMNNVYVIQGVVHIEDKPANNILGTIKKWLINLKLLPELKLMKILLNTGIELVINEARISDWDRPKLEVGNQIIMEVRR